MRKTTFEIYQKSLPKPFFTFLSSTNLVSGANKCAICLTSMIGILLAQISFSNGVLLSNSLVRKFFLKENLSNYVQNLFLFLKANGIVFSLIVQIKNLRKVFYCQNRLAYVIDETIVTFI